MTCLNKEAFEKACQKFDFMYFNSDGTMPIQAAIEEYVRETDRLPATLKPLSPCFVIACVIPITTS